MPLWFKRDRDEIAAMGKPPKTHESGLVVHTADPSKAPKDLVDLMTNLDAVVIVVFFVGASQGPS